MKYEKLAKMIINKRLERNLSLSAAAKEIGICYLTLWKIENGYTQLNYQTTNKLAQFLEISVKEVRDLC